MNRVEFLLATNDQLTPALTLASAALNKFKNGVKDADKYLEKLGKSAGAMDSFHGKIKGLGSSLMGLAGGNVLNGLDALKTKFGAMAAAAVALVGVKALTDAISNAGKEETATLMTVSEIAAGLGSTFGEAEKRVKNLKISIAEMAAPLPGTTETYTKFFQAVSGGLSRTFKGKPEEFEAVTKDITKRAGVLASIWNINGTDAGSVFDRLIQGNGGFREVALNDVIQRNGGFKNAMMEQMKVMGFEVEEWQAQSTETRLKVVQAALKIATPDDLIERFNDTFESVTQGLQTYWFNPLTGIFGVMREVSTDKGMTTGLQTVTETIRAMIDVGKALNTMATVKGISIDPMKMLIEFLQDFTQLLNGIEYFIRSGGQLPTFNFDLDIVGAIRGMAENVPKVLSGMFRGANSILASGDLAEVGTWLGEVINSLSLLLTNIFTKTDWIAIGETVGRFLGSTIRLAINFLAKLNYAQIGSAVFGFVQAVVLFGIGILKGIVLDFGKGIGSYLMSIWDGVKSQFGRVVDALKGTIDRILGAFSSLNPFQGSSNPVSAVSGVVSGVTNPIGNAIGTVVDGAKGVVNTILGKPETPSATDKPLTTPANNSKKVAYNNYSPSINVSAPDASSIGGTTLEALAAQYQTFTTQMMPS